MIESINNEKIKYYSKLKDKKYRALENLYLISTPHLVLEALKKDVVEIIFLLNNKKNIYGDNVTFVTEAVMRKLTDLDTIPEVVAVCKKTKSTEIEGNILILDRVQDPGNLGTILRSATAFNIDTIVLGNGCVDIYNEKVLRAAEGMHFHLNIIHDDLFNAINNLKKQDYKIIGTKLTDGVELKNYRKPEKFALIMGNEGRGVNQEILSLCDDYIYIKMNESCESLNVGVATSIILYNLNEVKNGNK